MPRKLMDGVVVMEEELTTAASDNEYQGKRKKNIAYKRLTFSKGIAFDRQTLDKHLTLYIGGITKEFQTSRCFVIRIWLIQLTTCL